MTLTLYKFGNSICTQKVMIVLAEKGVPYETIDVDLFKNEQYSPAYLAINPKGVVPSLVDDGKVVIESTLICEYLDETIPAPPLAPSDAHGRARMRLWSKAVDEGLCRGLQHLCRCRRGSGGEHAEPQENATDRTCTHHISSGSLNPIVSKRATTPTSLQRALRSASGYGPKLPVTAALDSATTLIRRIGSTNQLWP